MKKKLYIIVIILVIAIITVSIVLIWNNKAKNDSEAIIITRYSEGTSFQIKKVKINNEDDIKKFEYFIEVLKSSKAAQVDLALAKEVEISYKNYIVKIQLSQENYCLFIDQENNKSFLTNMPEGLYEFVSEKLKK